MGIEEFVMQRAKNEGIGIGKEIGKEIGREEERIQNKKDFAKELLTETDFSIEKIAKMVKMPVSFVENIKATMR
jgi:hypothetical protein